MQIKSAKGLRVYQKAYALAVDIFSFQRIFQKKRDML